MKHAYKKSSVNNEHPSQEDNQAYEDESDGDSDDVNKIDNPDNIMWQWLPFTSSARKDNLQLYHWFIVVNSVPPIGDYSFAKYNKLVDVLEYTDEEYEKYLSNRFWTSSYVVSRAITIARAPSPADVTGHPLVKEPNAQFPSGLLYLLYQRLLPLWLLFACLSYLHTQKIVHRDVKTENMPLGKTHTVNIADFGVARVEASNPNDMMG
ncbi:hypothetical protein BC332_18452 [Capsicum chinense]|nr:hypothetical protein BC332_18452 [Capsicum chinense]